MPQLLARFVTTDNYISWVIREVTDFWASHCEWVLDPDWQPYLAGKPLPRLDARDPGVLGAHFQNGVQVRPSWNSGLSRIENVALDVTEDQKHAVMQAATSRIGDAYDFAAICGILFKQNWRTKGREICSMFIADTTVNYGVPLLRVTGTIASITPRDLYLSPMWRTLSTEGKTTE